MQFCQLGQAQSLREIHEGLKGSEGKLVHLGMTKSPGHSTLAYANLHRPWQSSQDLFTALVPHLRAKLPVSAKTPLSLPTKLLSLDSTMIDLCAEVFDWARYKTTKGAVKIHLLLDHDGLLPHYAVITEGKKSDISVARTLDLPTGAMVVFDRGYCDYNWFAKLTASGVHFVTRLKSNAAFVAVESRPVVADSGVRGDEIVVFTQHATDDNDRFFRRIVYWDEQQQREFEFLTNHLTLDAGLVAAVYRQRWQIELLFRALKQNPKIKTFVGTSPNGMKIQIWTALIALLIVRHLQLRSRLQWHLSRFIALLRHQLSVYRDLWRFLDTPFDEGRHYVPITCRRNRPFLHLMILDSSRPASGPPVPQPQLLRSSLPCQSVLFSNAHLPAFSQFGQPF